jgi:hypothetical protein
MSFGAAAPEGTGDPKGPPVAFFDNPAARDSKRPDPGGFFGGGADLLSTLAGVAGTILGGPVGIAARVASGLHSAVSTARKVEERNVRAKAAAPQQSREGHRRQQGILGALTGPDTGAGRVAAAISRVSREKPLLGVSQKLQGK